MVKGYVKFNIAKALDLWYNYFIKVNGGKCMGRIYDAFKAADFFDKSFTDNVGLVKFGLDGKNYEIYLTHKRANKYSIIHLKVDTVEWEQFPVFPRIAGRMYGKSKPIIKLSPSKDSIKIFVVKGKPNYISGLDDGIFRSVHKYNEDYINVMSLARFKEI